MHHNILAPPQLPTPTLLNPAEGDIFLTNTTTLISWSNNGATNVARCRLEYTERCPEAGRLSDNMESGTNGWSVSHVGGSTTDWRQVTTAAHSPSTSWFAPNLTSVHDMYLVSPSFALEPDTQLIFWHRYDLEYEFDGGVIEISTNGPGGPFTDVGTSATANGYDTAISVGDGSPIGGRQAFTGTRSSFVQTIIPLPSVTSPAHLRFRLATDLGFGNTGWWIDDVTVSDNNGWVLIGTSNPNETNFLWTVPSTTGDAYCVRGTLTATELTDSDPASGAVFSITGDDSDGDGVPFKDEIVLGFNPKADDRNIDNDGDLLSNAGEFIARTDPNNASSVFDIVAFDLDPSISLTFSSAQGRVYAVYVATNMLVTNWSPLVQGIPGSNAFTFVTDTNTTPQRFYRIDVALEP